MGFPPHFGLAEKSFGAFVTARSKKTGEQTDRLVTTAASRKASCTSLAATSSDVLGVQGRRFTANVLMRTFDYASGASSGPATTRVGTSRNPGPLVSSAAAGPAS